MKDWKNSEQEVAKRRAAMMSALEDQLQNPKTPEVKQQYERLRREGHSDAETRRLMASILAVYIYHVMRGDAFTYQDYLNRLAKLPRIDSGEEDAVSSAPEEASTEVEAQESLYLDDPDEELSPEELDLMDLEEESEDEEEDEMLETLLFHVDLMILTADNEARKLGCPLNDSQIRSTLIKVCKLMEGAQPAFPEATQRDRVLKKLAMDIYHFPQRVLEHETNARGETTEHQLANELWSAVLEGIKTSMEDLRSNKPGSRNYLDFLHEYIPTPDLPSPEERAD